ncbi:MAG: chemotaxis protein CheW [Anaerolineaceae bacterium]|nr:chemotaxis protein CheW [Anaerolineaceae bacterium]
MERQLVVFELGTEYFGVGIDAVESIVKMQEITRMPQAPEFVEGVTNLRGTVLPVIDLRKRLTIKITEETKETRIVVINLNEMKVGMIVDGVSEVLTVSDDIIEPPPSMFSTVDTQYITGIARLDERLIILLDLGEVLSVREKMALQEM